MTSDLIGSNIYQNVSLSHPKTENVNVMPGILNMEVFFFLFSGLLYSFRLKFQGFDGLDFVLKYLAHLKINISLNENEDFLN